MKSIREIAEKLITEKNDFVTYEEIIEELETKDMDEKTLQARIYTDLITNGEFFVRDNKFNLVKNFTMEEVSKLKFEYDMSTIDDDIVEEKIVTSIEDENYDVDEIIDEKIEFVEELDD